MENFNFKKKYGQNFLRDENILNKIKNSININNDTLIIEVGPGDGALTKKLKELDVNVLAYEIDESLKERLDLLKDDKFNYILDDFLNRNIKEDIKNYSYKDIVLVANLPYYITTPIVEKIMNEGIISEAIIMVQDEVAKRLTGKPNSKNYGAFTVLLNCFYNTEYLFFVNRNSFYPIPNVDSAVIKLMKKEKNDIDYDKFKKLVFNAFQYKRKTLKNNLFMYDLDKIGSILSKYNLSIQNRAEQIPLEAYIDIYNSL